MHLLLFICSVVLNLKMLGMNIEINCLKFLKYLNRKASSIDIKKQK